MQNTVAELKQSEAGGWFVSVVDPTGRTASQRVDDGKDCTQKTLQEAATALRQVGPALVLVHHKGSISGALGALPGCLVVDGGRIVTWDAVAHARVRAEVDRRMHPKASAAPALRPAPGSAPAVKARKGKKK